MTKYKDIKEVNFNNITDTGTEGLKLPVGTTAQRGTTEGQIRYNSESDVIEFRDATDFKILAINQPPVFITATGSLGTLNDTDRSSSNLTAITFTDDNNNATLSIKAGSSLPSGITLNSNGTFSGTADAVASNTTTNFTLVLDDGVNDAVERNFSITVNAPVITFATASGSIGTINDADRGSYSFSSVTATVTSGTLSYAVQSGTLPSSLSLNTTTGAITGTLNAVNSNTTSTFTIRATTTSASVFADRQFTITVNAPVITWNTAAGSLHTVYDSQRSGFSYTTLSASATSGSVSYSVISGSVPSGLTFNSNGSFSGTANAVGSDTTSSFTVRASHSTASVSADRAFSITVKAPVQQQFGSSSSAQTFDTSSLKNFTAYLWGGGSQSGNQTAQGGFVSANVSVASGQNTLYIVVGALSSQSNNTSIWLGGRGNRGGSGGSYTGGGLTGIFTGSSPSQGNAVLIAGGAGGDGDGNNIGPLNGGNHSSSPENCCGTGGGGSGSALQGGSGGGGGRDGGGGGGGYVGGGGGGGACCSGNGGKGGSHYTGGNGNASTSSVSTANNANTGHSLSNGSYGMPGNDGRLILVY